MKNYLLDDRGKSKYIVDVREGKNGTLIVEFADGRVFTGIEKCDENIQKIIDVQESQAKKGIENYRKFKNKESHAVGLTFLSGAGSCLAGACAVSFIPALNNTVSGQPAVITATVGAITVLGMIPALAKLHREKSRVGELDKLRFRDSHLDDLRSFKKYPNALSGLNPRVANWIKSQDDPFNILDVDNYDVSDLTQIMSNIEVEKAYNFTYKNSNSRSR